MSKYTNYTNWVQKNYGDTVKFNFLFPVDEEDFSIPLCLAKKVTTKIVFDFLTEIIHRVPNVVTTVCGKIGGVAQIIVVKNDGTCDKIRFHIPQFTGYHMKQQTTVDYLRKLSATDMYLKRVDYKHNHEVIKIG